MKGPSALIIVFFFCVPSLFGQANSLDASIERGSILYQDFCMQCHQVNGKGEHAVYPPLAQSDYLLGNRQGSIRGVKYGQRGPMNVNGVLYDNTMAPMGLTDQEISDVMNYVFNSWGNSGQERVTPEEVAGIGPR
jgi:mono/diheme cytochrome c family protein